MRFHKGGRGSAENFGLRDERSSESFLIKYIFSSHGFIKPLAQVENGHLVRFKSFLDRVVEAREAMIGIVFKIVTLLSRLEIEIGIGPDSKILFISRLARLLYGVSLTQSFVTGVKSSMYIKS